MINTRTILMRLRRKAQIVKLDMERQNNNAQHDMAEILNLIAMLEREWPAE